MERVIQTLKQDIPTLFEKEISYNIYTNDIYFQDPISRFKGKFNYLIIFWTLRFHPRLFFTTIYFDIHDISQTDKKVITANWKVRSTLPVPWKAHVFFNGSSSYLLTKDGLSSNHLDTWDRKPSEILKQFFRRGLP
ncbi:MAG: DUF2358 domain-containing protein [Moorea sp. SIO3G5]|nr:DUF2358 domain-containing protein [Moorena sp. SIO3G5]